MHDICKIYNRIKPEDMFGIKMLSSALFFLLLTNPIFSDEQTKITVVDRPNTNAVNTSYRQNRTPLLPQNFIKLPVGSVKPEGWILKLLELQKEGLNGQLGEISASTRKTMPGWVPEPITDGRRSLIG